MADSEGYLHYGGELGPQLNTALNDANSRRNSLLLTNLALYGINGTLQRMTAAEVTARYATASDSASNDLKDAIADVCSKLGANNATTVGEMNASMDKAIARLRIA